MKSDLNFHLWLDFLARDFLAKDFKTLVQNGIISGCTSNPSIFAQAISTDAAYNEDKQRLNLKGKALYEALAVQDIKTACDLLRPVYQANPNQGFVSIEVDPLYCYDSDKMQEEALRLYETIARDNLMIKIPATDPGLKVVTFLLKKGIAVNTTLIFSFDQAQKTLTAIKKSESNTRAVLSVFVSRFDRLCDDMLPESLKGMAGIFNASKLYNLIQKQNLSNISTLFASTGVKAASSYDDSYYIRELIGDNVINTAPLNTIKAFKKEGDILEPTLPRKDLDLDRFFKILNDRGISMHSVCDELLETGLAQFKDAFRDLITSLQ